MSLNTFIATGVKKKVKFMMINMFLSILTIFASILENSMDPDQLSSEKPTLALHCLKIGDIRA